MALHASSTTWWIHSPGSLNPLVSWRRSSPSKQTINVSRRGARQRLGKVCVKGLAVAAAGHQETLPDGSSHTFPTPQHAEDFWLLWRHLMPLAGSQAYSQPELHGDLHPLGYPRVRLQRHWVKPADVPNNRFADGSLVGLAAAIQRALPKDGKGARTLAVSEFGINLRVIIRTEPSSSEGRSKRTGSWKVYANPSIVWRSRPEWERESCEWLPGVDLRVPRPSAVLVKASDERGRFNVTLLRGEDARQFARAWDAMAGALPLDFQHPEVLRRLREKLDRLESDGGAEHNLSRHAQFLARGGIQAKAALGPRMHRSSCFASYHEAGHTLLGILLPVARVEGVFVQRKGSTWSGGTEIVWPSVAMHPDDIIIQAAAVWLGGLAAEELMFGRADLGAEVAASFADDLLNVAALGTAFVARRRDPALWSSNDQWDTSVRQLATAPPPTGWRSPAGSIEPAAAELLENGAAGLRDRASLKSENGRVVPANQLERGGNLEGLQDAGEDERHASELLGGRVRDHVFRNLTLAPNDSTNANLLCFVNTAYDMAIDLLVKNVDALHSIAGMLMDQEAPVSSQELENIIMKGRDQAESSVTWGLV